MKAPWLGPLAVAVLGFRANAACAAEYYVDAEGDDDANGSEQAPFATVGRAQQAATAGDTVFIRGGTYTISGTSRTVGVAFTKSGAEGRRIQYFAYPGELPVFDLSGLQPEARVTGFDVTANWIHIRGIELRGTQQVIVGDSWGVRIRGSNNIIEQMNVHHGEAPGIFITSGANNLILNCDSHHNYDPLEGGGNGDGFGCHSTGGNNVIRGCRAYANSDDGFDFINAPGTCIVENSWAFRNGYVPDTMTAAGNGAGFKAGGFGLDTSRFPATIPRHVVRNCVAFGNRAQGFYANHHPGGIDFLNNTAFRNPVNFNMLADVGASSHKLRNNIAMAPGTAINNLTGGTDTFNSWSLPVSVSPEDFLSVAEKDAEAPRQPDGSLPDVSFLRLAPDSDLVDRGEDVGLPFVGSAPDLGAFELGAAPSAGGAASGGNAGGASAGGVSAEVAGAGTQAAGVPNGGTASAGRASGGAGTAVSAGETASERAGAGGRAKDLPSGGTAMSGGSAGSNSAGRMTANGGSAEPMSGGADGCACRARSGGSARQALGAGLLLALVVVRARRRRERTTSL